MPESFARALASLFQGNCHRHFNRTRRLRTGACIICIEAWKEFIWEYCDDCGDQLGRRHVILHLQHFDALINLVNTLPSDEGVSLERKPQEFHIICTSYQ